MIVYKCRLLKKSSHQKCTTWLSNIAFHLQPIWLETLVAIDAASCLTSFLSFCSLPSEVAVLFNSNLSRCPFLRKLVDLDLLICTGFNLEHAVLLLCHIFTQGPRTIRKFKLGNWSFFGLQQLLAYSIEIFISHEK